MALTRFFFPTCMVFLSLLVINVAAFDYGSIPKEPQFGIPHPDHLGYGNLLPLDLFGVQGLVLCNSGSENYPIKGAVARITCLGEDENGYETAPFSVLSGPTDATGYFFASLSPCKIEDNYSKNWKLTQCKVFLDYSPLESCNVPTYINHGISGFPLSSYRTLSDSNMRLFSVGPFFYGSEATPAPNGY